MKLVRNFCLVLVILLIASTGQVKAADPILINQDWWVPNGSISSMVIGDDGTTYLGGNFTHFGPYTGSFVSLDVTT